jgi:hypothetical protein
MSPSISVTLKKYSTISLQGHCYLFIYLFIPDLKYLHCMRDN